MNINKNSISLIITVIGRRWKLRVLTKRHYKKRNGAGSLGVTKGYKRRIDLHPLGVDLETIIHELYHAYMYELCASSTNMDVDDLEEFNAELLAKYGKRLLGQADLIYARIVRAT